jgi:hypothetical protein
MGAEIPDGAFLVARAILNSSLWTMRPEDRIVAITCIGLTSWRPSRWFDGKQNITINRGQFVRSWDGLAEACNLSVKTTRTCVKHLESAGFLARKQAGRYSVYTIPKYEFYQRMANYSDSAGKNLGSERAASSEKQAKSGSEQAGTGQRPGNIQEGLRREKNGKKEEEETGGTRPSDASPTDSQNDAPASSEDQVLLVTKYAKTCGVYAASDKQLRSVLGGLLTRGMTLESITSCLDLNKGRDVLKIDFAAEPPRATYGEIAREEDINKVEIWLDGWIGDGPKPVETRIGNRWYVKTQEGNYRYSKERTDYWISEYSKGNGNGKI